MGSFAEQRRQTSCVSKWIRFALLGVIFSICFQVVWCDTEPTESQCRPYIEKALKEQHLEEDRNIEGAVNQESLNEQEALLTDDLADSTEGIITNEDEDGGDVEADVKKEDEDDDDEGGENDDANEDVNTKEETDSDDKDDEEEKKQQDNTESMEETVDDQKDEESEDQQVTAEEKENVENESEVKDGDGEDDTDDEESNLEIPISVEIQEVEMNDDDDNNEEETEETEETTDTKEETETDENKSLEGEEEVDNEKDEKIDDNEDRDDEITKEEKDEETKEDETDEVTKEDEKDDREDDDDNAAIEEKDEETKENEKDSTPDDVGGGDDDDGDDEDTKKEKEVDDEKETEIDDKDDKEDDEKELDDKDESSDVIEESISKETTKLDTEGAAENEAEADTEQESPEEEELINEVVVPDNLRPRDHIDKILRLEDSGLETFLEKTIDTTLKTLKGLYDNAIKPLEMLYKYRDLSNRHFGDPEIFSKPLILFMGPWSGGKSSTINYLLDNEFSKTSLRTGAEPSPAYFNILMHGEEEEILDGTQLAADWTFSGLQKFGQTLLDRLKGIKLPNKLLEKVNIVEIPGILEIRKQVQRLFPFNDACQWFIDRADIIFLVYDPSKLDVGPETEAILDQLKGREYQTRIILNKADQVKPEELMRVQGTLIWNISPLMSSSEPPIMYTTSLWSLPYETGAPIRLLQAQERAFLRDLREAIDKRVENKIASARRFAVRVRNHAKMVDCYLTTYYNHKTIFGNRKRISDDIIEYPQKYHIYEGLSTLTNISRYDLPDPDVYRDFFKINPLYEFKKLSETCTYFRGCPINKLDVAIAYDLPELVGKYKKAVDSAKENLQKENS